MASTSQTPCKQPVAARGGIDMDGGEAAERPPVAPDDAVSTIELVVNMLIAGILFSVISGMVAMSVQVFGFSKNVNDLPERVVQRELTRAAKRMLPIERCESPEDATRYTECLEVEEVPFPAPWHTETGTPPTLITKPAMYTHADGYHDVLCWMVVHTKDRPSSFGTLNTDTRDLECWYHNPDADTVFAAIHHPKTNGSDTSDEFSPEWAASPYRVAAISARVERLGYCITADGNMLGQPDEVNCKLEPGGKWQNAWGCVHGIDTDPASEVTTTIQPTNRVEEPCNSLNNRRLDTSQGAAVLTMRLCVTMSAAELKNRSHEDEWAVYPITCKPDSVTVTPGRKSL